MYDGDDSEHDEPEFGSGKGVVERQYWFAARRQVCALSIMICAVLAGSFGYGLWSLLFEATKQQSFFQTYTFSLGILVPSFLLLCLHTTGWWASMRLRPTRAMHVFLVLLALLVFLEIACFCTFLGYNVSTVDFFGLKSGLKQTAQDKFDDFATAPHKIADYEERYECCGWNEQLTVSDDQQAQRTTCVAKTSKAEWCFEATKAALGDVFFAFGTLGCVAIILQALCLSAAVQVLAAQHGVDEENGGERIKTGHTDNNTCDEGHHVEMGLYAADDLDFM